MEHLFRARRCNRPCHVGSHRISDGIAELCCLRRRVSSASCRHARSRSGARRPRPRRSASRPPKRDAPKEPDLDRLAAQVEADGGAVVGRYSDPFGGTPLLLVALPVDRVEPTPYQRDASDAHVKRLMGVIETIGRFLDPIVAVRRGRAVPDAERQPSAAGAEEARRENDHGAARARPGGRLQDPGAEHRKGAQPPREVARDDPHGARAGEARRQQRKLVRVRVRAAGLPDARHLLRGSAAAERRRLPVDPPPRRRISGRADRQGDQGARSPRPEDPEAGRRGQRGGREAEGEGASRART